MSLFRLGSILVKTSVRYHLFRKFEEALIGGASRKLATGQNRIHELSAMAEENDPRKFTKEEWLNKLSPEQYYICREKGTEEPFSGKYYMHKEDGVYTCICCGTELFSSKSKYDSGTGWPSFKEGIGASDNGNETHTNILHRSDNSLGTVRTEVICKKCDGHLGHVFTDGPPPTGHRYCINSAALKFCPKKLS